jgi:electron transfer flavoprotein beta subunit
MNIIVCIKQVPDTTNVRIDPETNTLIRTGVQSIINPFDTYAIEEGVRLKEKFGGIVTVITMGPPQAEEALREAISLGADEALLVSDKVFAGSDTWATSYTLSRTIQKIGRFDIIICGKQAIDGDTAQVGPGIAAFLDVPQITFVKKIEEIATINQHGHNESRATNDERRLIRAERMTEEGYDIIESPLPCVITVVKEINEPRLPSLKGKMRAKKIEIKRLEAKDLDADPDSLGLKGSPTKVVKIFTPPPRKGGQILQGEVKEVCGKLLELLKGEIS